MISPTGNLRLILVRHGNTFEDGQIPLRIGRRTDLPLTDKGRAQARNVGIWLKSHDIEPRQIFSGRLKRQIETARIIALSFSSDIPVSSNEGALEEIDYGQWEGLSDKEIEQLDSRALADWNDCSTWPEGIFDGTEKDLRDRLSSWLATLTRTFDDGDVVVAVSSNGTIRYFRSFLAEEWNELVSSRAMKTVKVGTGRICELTLRTDGLSVVRWDKDPRS